MSGMLKKNLAKDYGLTLSWRFAEVDFLGLPKLKDEPVARLEHIYVPLRVCANWPDRFKPDQTLYVPRALQQYRRLLILGDPGSGKSTLIKVLTYAFGEPNANAYKRACGELLPIPIILRDYATRQWKDYRQMLTDFIATLDADIRAEVTADWLLGHLRGGTAILLIDGLDEVGAPEERRRLRDEIIFPLLDESQSSFAVLTSRIVGHEEAPFDAKPLNEQAADDESNAATARLFRYYVAPFNEDEISQFITRWYQLRESNPQRQQLGMESLVRALNQNDRVKRLANNPQLLTLIALIHRVTANLPSGRVELYDKIVEAYLETIQTFRKFGTPAKLDEMKRWLGKVGWEMQLRRDAQQKTPGTQATGESDELLVSRDDIRQWLTTAITRERGHSGADESADGFLEYVAKRSGLLVPRGPDRFAFVHLTFQEYFAAFDLRSQIRRFDQLSATCVELSAKRHWHETLNLLFEMLAEFPGACDDLFFAISVKAKTDPQLRRATAQLFSALLADEQNGLTAVSQDEAAGFVLTSVVEDFDGQVIKHLQVVPAELQQRSIIPWFIRGLQEHTPPLFARSFFNAANLLVPDWSRVLAKWLSSPAYHNPGEQQLVTMMETVSTAQDSERFCSWAVSNLPLRLWLNPASKSAWYSLADLYREVFYSTRIGADAPLLLHFVVAQGIAESLLLRLQLARRTFQLFPNMLFPLGLTDIYFMSSFRALPSEPNVHIARTLFSRPAVRPGSFMSSFIATTLATSMGRAAVAAPVKLRTEDPFLKALADAESTLFMPDSPPTQTIEELKGFLSRPDDWSRLSTISALLMLGEGTPDLCRERNALLQKGATQSKDFRFPPELAADVHQAHFVNQLPLLLSLTYLDVPSLPLLKPKFFEKDDSKSKYFLSGPRELYAIVADELDPLGTTGLSKWKSL